MMKIIITIIVAILLLHTISVIAQTKEEYCALAKKAGNQKQYNEAIAYYLKAIDIDTNCAFCYFKIADIKLYSIKDKDYESIRSYLYQALKVHKPETDQSIKELD